MRKNASKATLTQAEIRSQLIQQANQAQEKFKESEYAEEFADEIGVSTPLFSATSPIYESAMAEGFGEQDTAAVFAVLQNMAVQKQAEMNKS